MNWSSKNHRWQVYEEFEEVIGSKLLDNSLKNKMSNGIGKLSKENFYSAVVYGVLAVALVVISQGTIFGLNWKALVDVGVLGVITSLVKNLLTTDKGNVVGVIPVIPDKS